MFKKLKDAAMKKILKRKLKDQPMPEEQKDQLINAMMNNPELFKNIEEKIKKKIKHEGKTKMQASMEVMKDHQADIRKAMGL